MRGVVISLSLWWLGCGILDVQASGPNVQGVQADLEHNQLGAFDDEAVSEDAGVHCEEDRMFAPEAYEEVTPEKQLKMPQMKRPPLKRPGLVKVDRTQAKRTSPVMLLSGSLATTGQYFVSLLMGSPAQLVDVPVTFENNSIAVHCGQDRPHSGTPVDFLIQDTVFNPGASRTLRAVAPEDCDQVHGKVVKKSCLWVDSKGYPGGAYVRDRISVGGNPGVALRRFVCLDGSFPGTGPPNGFFGLAYPWEVQEQNILHEFSICAAAMGGLLKFGSRNDKDVAGKLGTLKYTPMVVSPTGYQVSPESLMVNGVSIDINTAMAISIESATTFLPSAAYSGLRRVLDDLKLEGLERHGSCWTLPGGADDLDKFPNIHFNFSSVTHTWHPEAYMVPKGVFNSFCYGFDDAGDGIGVLGISWMIGQDLHFDMRNEKFGMASAKCSLLVKGVMRAKIQETERARIRAMREAEARKELLRYSDDGNSRFAGRAGRFGRAAHAEPCSRLLLPSFSNMLVLVGVFLVCYCVYDAYKTNIRDVKFGNAPILDGQVREQELANVESPATQ